MSKVKYYLLNKKMEHAEAVLANVADRDNNIYRVYFEANPIPDEQRKAGFGGINRYKSLEGYDNSKLIIESNKRLDILQKQIVVQSKSLDDIAVLAEEKEKLLSIPRLMHIDLPEKRYYAIGEVAKAFGVNTSLVRFWEKEFDVLKPKKNAKGNRKFTPEDIKNLKFIYHLVKERGFTLEGAKTHLKEEKKQALNNFEIISKLEDVKNQLIKIKQHL